MTSIYDNEQYLFELAQSFIRSRVIFTCFHLKLFDLLQSHQQGLTCEEIAEDLHLHYLPNQSRCLVDVLDALTSMKMLERDCQQGIYRLSSLTKQSFLPHQILLAELDEEFYPLMPQFHQRSMEHLSKESIYALMLIRIEELIDLKPYSHRIIDRIEENSDLIILWRQNRTFAGKLQHAFDVLPSNGKGLLIVILSDDEVTLTLNLFLNMIVDSTTKKDDEEIEEQDWQKILKQIGFETVERMQSTHRGDFALLLAYK